MGRETSTLLPKHERLLADLGENLRLARLRRKLSAEQVAERAGVSRSTLHLMENGSAGISLGKLVQVLAVLGLEQDLSAVGSDDVLGRKLEDARLTETRRRAPKRKLKPWAGKLKYGPTGKNSVRRS
jgi:transcriptional regulator with XRE-family HTH domain